MQNRKYRYLQIQSLNYRPRQKAKLQDQPLEWHLHQVGDRASRIAVQMMTDLSLSGLSEQTVEYICQPTTYPPTFPMAKYCSKCILQKYTEAS